MTSARGGKSHSTPPRWEVNSNIFIGWEVVTSQGTLWKHGEICKKTPCWSQSPPTADRDHPTLGDAAWQSMRLPSQPPPPPLVHVQ